MTTDFTWQFPRNEANEIEGPNNSGIANFLTSRKDSVIRESVQNSLDAQANKNRPVKVEFALVRIPTASFKADSLLPSLYASIESPHNEGPHVEQFRRGRSLIDRASGGSLECLKITDSNTTGADDVPRNKGAPSKWEALTKGTGSNAKDQRDAAGSFGLGKFAAFAASDLQMILYTSAWSGNSGLQRRFQGKIILVSHKDNRGNDLRSTGYLGAPGFHPLCDLDIPREFMLRQPGTAIFIPGYQPESRWQDTSVTTVIKHFFHAIIHSKLEVSVDEYTVKANTIDRFLGLLDSRTVNFIKVSKMEPVAQTTIPDIGDISIRILKHDETVQDKEVTLVRDAGMMITDRPRDMNLPGLGRFPGHWHGFTAIIECLSHGKPSLLRESESPEHNRISTDFIADSNRRREANRRLKELGEWYISQIKRLAEPQISDETDNASEMAKYLPIPEDDGLYRNDNRHFGVERSEMVTTPIQSNRAPRRTPSHRGRTSTRQRPGPGDDVLNPDGPRRNRTRRQRGGRSNTGRVPTAFSNPRFRPGTKKPTHSVVVTFDNPGEPLRDVRLIAVAEDGQDVPMGISGALIAGENIAVENDVVPSLDNGTNDRLSIEFTTREPVLNKTFYIRGMTDNDEI